VHTAAAWKAVSAPRAGATSSGGIVAGVPSCSATAPAVAAPDAKGSTSEPVKEAAAAESGERTKSVYSSDA